MSYQANPHASILTYLVAKKKRRRCIDPSRHMSAIASQDQITLLKKYLRKHRNGAQLQRRS
jgi:hypothetical protein